MFFVFRGSLDNQKSVGTNNLIKEFAQIVTTPEDILLKYGYIEPFENMPIISKDLNIENDIPEEYIDIYKVITEEPLDINGIAKKSNKDLKTVMSKLTMLELEGKIKKVAGNRYLRGGK